MKHNLNRKHLVLYAAAAAAWLFNGEFSLSSPDGLIASAQAVVGAPVTPVSYAGVARRSTVGAGAPGVGVTAAPGVGGPANRGGPVNRVGRH